MSSSLEYLHLQSISQAEGVQLLSLRVPCRELFAFGEAFTLCPLGPAVASSSHAAPAVLHLKLTSAFKYFYLRNPHCIIKIKHLESETE